MCLKVAYVAVASSLSSLNRPTESTDWPASYYDMFHIMHGGFHGMLSEFHIIFSGFHIMFGAQRMYHNAVWNVACI